MHAHPLNQLYVKDASFLHTTSHSRKNDRLCTKGFHQSIA